MASQLALITGLVVVFTAVLYQFFLHDLVFTNLGFGRSLQPLSDFPYTCRRIRHPKLEACEDLWIDDKSRTLYAACSRTADRLKWQPTVDSLNSTDLGPGDHVSVLDLDAAGSDGLYGLRQLRPVGGPSELRLHGFDAEAVDESTLRFFLINHRVPVGAAGRRIPAEAIGANSTMEVYDVERGSEEMRHVRTVYDPSTIYTPNKIAVLGDGGFLLTNDHSRKTGLRKNLELVLRGGSITYCDASFKCREVKKDGMAFPNGLVRGHDGLIYVPSSAGETALVLRFHPKNGSMTEVAQLKLGYPVDNFVVDQLGDIYAAALAKAYISIGHFKNASVEPPATVLKISKDKGAYTVKKVLEDRDGEVISGIASACHDAKTGMVFLGGLILPFVSVCVRA